jgi:hypothetical protein
VILKLKRTQSDNQKYEKNEMETRKEKLKVLEDEFKRSQSDYIEFSRKPFSVIEVTMH